MAQELRVLTAFAEDWMPSTHVGQLTTAHKLQGTGHPFLTSLDTVLMYINLYAEYTHTRDKNEQQKEQ